MMNFYVPLFFLIFSQGINGHGTGKYVLPVDCRGERVFPWFEGCGKYIQCSGKMATVETCSQELMDKNEQIKKVCNLDESQNCGYSRCQGTFTGVVAFNNAQNTKTPYYATCVKGVILHQSICVSKRSEAISNFDEDEQACVLSCEGDGVTTNNNCTEWTWCIENQLIENKCPENIYFDISVQYCRINYTCPLLLQNTIREETTPSTEDSDTSPPLKSVPPTVRTTTIRPRKTTPKLG